MYAQEHFRRKESRDVMYRSNSSLDLIYAEHPSGNGLRREYGSHGSIDVIGNGVERVSTMVHNYNGISSTDKASGLGRAQERLTEPLNSDHADGPAPRASASPKPRLKLNKLWGGAGPTLARPPIDDASLTPDCDGAKRKQFAHFDCQSLMANLSYAAEARGLLSRRRNTTTGASAASLIAARGAPPGDVPVPDMGDGRSNELLESCPFFRNELGGEEERCVSLCWRTARGAITGQAGGWHRPAAAYGLSVLEFPPGQTHWKSGCPFARSHNPLPIESQDMGALYYRNYFYNQNHQNWFGMDENLGPVAVSIKKERVELRRGCADLAAPASMLAWQYRLVIRTSELLTLRGSVLEDVLPVKPTNNSATYNTKEALEYVAPELQLSCLRLAPTNNGAEEQLLKLDEQCLTKYYKVGVMYCKAGQSTEEEMYNNQEAGPAFVEFLQMLGQTVRLKDFDKYKAGLDNKNDSTGLYSVYTTYQGCEIMFHVSTMLPYTPNNRQQLLRKRHIGNDIVTIVFQEPGAAPFTPRNIRSQFQHVFVVVRAIDPCSDNTYYSIAVSRAKEVPLFGPPIKDGAVYPKGETFTDLLLAKVINGENAAIQSPKFSAMARRTRQEYLKELALHHVTPAQLDAGQKFSIFSSLLSKGGASHGPAVRDAPNTDMLVGGALYFQVQVQDEGSGGVAVSCVLGVSSDTFVLIEESSRQVVLVLPTESLLGWTVSGSWTRVFFHRGESVRLGVSGAGGVVGAGVSGGGVAGAALRRRLAGVAPPHATLLTETTLERGPSAQLGFHVSPEGVVAGVEAGAMAARRGVRRGARLLEVCRAAVVALAHAHLLDLLTASDPVTVTLTFASYKRCTCDSERENWQRTPQRGGAQRPRPHRPDSSGYATGSSGRSERRSPQQGVGGAGAGGPGGVGGAGNEVGVRRRSHDDCSPRHRQRRDNTTSLTEELMRLMDSELGEGRSNSAPVDVTTVRDPALRDTPLRDTATRDTATRDTSLREPHTLPLPAAGPLDWATLVRTATRAMLQICEEHQYPSLDNTETSLDSSLNEPTQDNCSEPSSETWSETGAGGGEEGARPPLVPARPACGCGAGARAAQAEAAAAAARAHARRLDDEVRRLRRHNERLREESARAVWQLRHFTQWLKRTVDKQ